MPEGSANVDIQQLKVYADTSVFGGVFDPEFSAPSRKFFDEVDAGRFFLVISPVVEEEVGSAPEAVQELFAAYYNSAHIEEISNEALELRAIYLEFGIVTGRSVADALHVAIATLAGCELIVSWNFRDIVHFDKIRKYNAVNTLKGYGQLGIHSPLEVIQHDNP